MCENVGEYYLLARHWVVTRIRILIRHCFCWSGHFRNSEKIALKALGRCFHTTKTQRRHSEYTAQLAVVATPRPLFGEIRLTLYTRGFSHFFTSMTAPIASGRSDSCRVGPAPTEERRLTTAHTQAEHSGFDWQIGMNRKPGQSVPLPQAYYSTSRFTGMGRLKRHALCRGHVGKCTHDDIVLRVRFRIGRAFARQERHR